MIQNALENRFVAETAAAAGGDDWWIGKELTGGREGREMREERKERIMGYIIFGHRCLI